MSGKEVASAPGKMEASTKDDGARMCQMVMEESFMGMEMCLKGSLKTIWRMVMGR